MDRPRLLRRALGVPLLSLAGCFSTATMHTARPIAQGTCQAAVALGTSWSHGPSGNDSIPSLEGQFRYGCHERVDVGFQSTNLASLGADANVALWLDDSVALSVDPTVQLYGLVNYYWLPVLCDFYTSERLTLTAAVRAGYMDVRLDLDADEDDVFPFEDVLGHADLLGIGLAARIRTGDGTFLMPELGATRIDPDGGEQFVVYSAAVGFAF